MPTSLPIHRIEIGLKPGHRDPRGEHVARQVREFLHLEVDEVETADVYHLEADLSTDEAEQIVAEFADPVRQRAALGRLEYRPFDVAVRVAFKPGVTDPVGKSALVAAEDTLGRKLGGDAAAYTSTLYLFRGLDVTQAQRVATELLANPVIQTISVATWDEWSQSQPDLSVPKVAGGATPQVQAIDLSGSDEDLLEISRKGLLALSLVEMQTIRDHFRGVADDPHRAAAGLGGAPTDVELECLAQTWSEHCKHKIFNATIEYREGESNEKVGSLFKTYIRGTTETVRRQQIEREGESWLVSVFHDNAGVVTFDDEVHLVYKVETHNSPSALDPYGGAITGIVGVNRDPFGTGRGADLLVNVWGYCFGPQDWDSELPPGLLHPRRIREGVHWGVIDGGNQSGVPYGRGWEVFDHRYLGKPLVFCGTVGSLPVEIDGTPGEDKAARPGDRIVMAGGRIGADGIHGATFSSAALDEESPNQAVQIGDPITQRMMFDFLLEARDLGLYSAITDNGAGGLSSSVGEMAETPGGATLDLAQAPLKYAGLAPWEIFLSEAQERMTLAVPPENLGRLLELAARREVEATDLGEFTAEPVLRVLYGEETVALLDMHFLHEGDPEMVLPARWSAPEFPEPDSRHDDLGADGLGKALRGLLASPNLASNENWARHYDHEVKALSVVKPWVGVHQDVPAEATVFLARHSSGEDAKRGFVLSEGVNPYLSDLDTEAMAATVVDEAVRRQLCAGGRLDRIAALDNFCWPDPVLSESAPDGDYKLAQLVRACRGLHDTCVAYGVPLISGKDSMKNDAFMGGVKISVPPTLLVSAIGQIDDVEQALTLDFKQVGDLIYVLGMTGEHTGASEYFRWLGQTRSSTHPVTGDEVTSAGVTDDRVTGDEEFVGEGLAPSRGFGKALPIGNKPPTVETEAFWPLYQAVERAARAGLLRSAATPTKGGLAVALAKCALAGDLGVNVDLDLIPGAADLDPDVVLFSESNGRFVVTVAPENQKAFAAAMAGLPCARVGVVSEKSDLVLRRGDRELTRAPVAELRSAFYSRRSDV